MDTSASRRSPVSGSCELGNEAWSKILDCLSDYHPLKKVCVPWREFLIWQLFV